MSKTSHVPVLKLPAESKHSSYAFVGPFTGNSTSIEDRAELDLVARGQQKQVAELQNTTSDSETLYDSDDQQKASPAESDSDWDLDSAPFSTIPSSSSNQDQVLHQSAEQQHADVWQWSELKPEDEIHLRPYFTESLRWISSCDAYFTDLVHRHCPASYTIVEGILFVRRWEEEKDGSGKWLLLPPMFKDLPDNLEHMAQVMRVALKMASASCFDAVSAKYLTLVEDHLIRAGLAASPADSGDWDYIYSCQELINLDGSSSLKEKRRRARTFANRYEPKVVPLSPSNWSESLLQRCLTVAENWVKENGSKVGTLEDDSECLRDHNFTVNLLRHFDKHPNMRGVLVEVGGQDVALALVELEHGGRMLLSHVEKSLLKAVSDSAFGRGIYPFTLRSYLEQWKEEGFETVNRESDDGIPGLRESKNLYKPIEWRQKFIISERSV